MLYSLANVRAIIDEGFEYSVSPDVVSNITAFARQIGHHDNLKYPSFVKKVAKEPTSLSVIYNQTNGTKRHRNKVHEADESEWEASIKKTASITSNNPIQQIRNSLNKLTDKNYCDVRSNIIDVLNTILPLEEQSVATDLFQLMSTNKMFVLVYADLYTDLMNTFRYLQFPLQRSIDLYIDTFRNMVIYDPNTHYDEFCNANKANEQRRALSAFYVRLTKNKKIQLKKLSSLTHELTSLMWDFIQTENKRGQVEEICENIAIMYNHDIDNTETESESEEEDDLEENTSHHILHRILGCKSKLRDYPSLTMKTIFKVEDILSK
jgi:hypothetical protein